ncbi:GntR family transcriptional regulator/MocR family aminotransferase [Nonomuraea soli]|uniref:GntR family transcriptional regulator/MocR family aminotransferase n=2 Tax=Nonomuraea soli TaxID=1032476 RepID=A0A7W0HVW5_9ACTN|nr:GntR family transcriptional regulator/MocR family aminotransferase [Nonomuraea soli]
MMELHIDRDGPDGLSEQIYQQIRTAILDGRLRPGDPLPSTREAARQLGISRTTIASAYDLLSAEGLVGGRVGAGTFVRTSGPHPCGVPETRHGSPLRPRTIWDTVAIPTHLSEEPEFDFRAGLPDARLFPYQTWRRLITRELRTSAVRAGIVGEPAGHQGLREAIARHVGVSRAVRADPADIVVTNGSQQALDLIVRVLLRPGDRVAIENPGYPLHRNLLATSGMNVAPVPVDAEGLVVEALPDDCRLVIVTPSHQLPLGVRMSLPRRLALLAWAAAHDAAIVEDDYDSEFRFAGPPLETLHALDRSGRVIYLGTFSKVMLITLRLGFCVVPAELRQAMRAAKHLADWFTPVPVQAALAGFIDEGLLAQHIRRMHKIYGERHRRIAAAIHRDFTPWLEPIPSAAGLHQTAWLRSGAADELFPAILEARKHGVGIFTVRMFAAPGTDFRNGLLFGYGSIRAESIDGGLRIIRNGLVR